MHASGGCVVARVCRGFGLLWEVKCWCRFRSMKSPVAGCSSAVRRATTSRGVDMMKCNGKGQYCASTDISNYSMERFLGRVGHLPERYLERKMCWIDLYFTNSLNWPFPARPVIWKIRFLETRDSWNQHGSPAASRRPPWPTYGYPITARLSR